MIRILTDSASDILPAEAKQLGVTVIPLNVTLEDGTVLRDGVDTSMPQYYGIAHRWKQVGDSDGKVWDLIALHYFLFFESRGAG